MSSSGFPFALEEVEPRRATLVCARCREVVGAIVADGWLWYGYHVRTFGGHASEASTSCAVVAWDLWDLGSHKCPEIMAVSGWESAE